MTGPYHITSHHIISTIVSRITTCRIVSYRITYHHITSHYIVSQCIVPRSSGTGGHALRRVGSQQGGYGDEGVEGKGGGGNDYPGAVVVQGFVLGREGVSLPGRERPGRRVPQEGEQGSWLVGLVGWLSCWLTIALLVGWLVGWLVCVFSCLFCLVLFLLVCFYAMCLFYLFTCLLVYLLYCSLYLCFCLHVCLFGCFRGCTSCSELFCVCFCCSSQLVFCLRRRMNSYRRPLRSFFGRACL